MEKEEQKVGGVDIHKITIENALAISSLTQVVNRTSTDIDKLIKHAEKTDKIIMNNSKLETRVDDLECQVKADKKSIDIIYAIAKYPKSTVALLAFSYVFTIDEVRTAIFEHLQPIAALFKLLGM